jgi:hypothetical protein
LFIVVPPVCAVNHCVPSRVIAKLETILPTLPIRRGRERDGAIAARSLPADGNQLHAAPRYPSIKLRAQR